MPPPPPRARPRILQRRIKRNGAQPFRGSVVKPDVMCRGMRDAPPNRFQLLHLAGRRSFWLAALLLWAVLPPTFGSATNDLVWRKTGGVDASIDHWHLKKFLARLSSVTGWKIYTVPEL